MSASSSLSLVDFTAYELPAKRWMKLVRPRMRLRVRLPDQNRDFFSAPVKVPGDPSKRVGTTDFSSVGWPWNNDDQDTQFPQPCFADDDVFSVEVERRFLLWYRCIRRTKPVTIDQVRTGDYCALSLYDDRQFVDVSEERPEIGEITFSLRSDATSEDASSQGSKVSFPTYYA